MRIVRFFLLYCFAVSLASFAAAFVRERESRDYMPTYGPYRHKSDITEEMMDEWACYGEGIQPNVYFTMMETVPETSGLGFDPKDLTCGGEFVIPCDRSVKSKGDVRRDARYEREMKSLRRRAVLGANEWLRELEQVKPWPELKKELDRYGMRAYEIDFWGRYFGALTFTCPKKRGKLPVLVYIPGLGEIGEDLASQFRQRKFFDTVTSERFQKRYPCHVLALSPNESLDRDRQWMSGSTFARRAYRMLHKVAKVAFEDRVDWSRIYLVGFSYGATRAMDVLFAYPRKYAACIAVAGVIPPLDAVKGAWGKSTPMVNVWYVANDGDDAAKDEDCVRFSNDLKKYVNSHKGDFRVTYFKDAPGHNAWDRTWDSEFLWKWLFSKKRLGGR